MTEPIPDAETLALTQALDLLRNTFATVDQGNIHERGRRLHLLRMLQHEAGQVADVLANQLGQELTTDERVPGVGWLRRVQGHSSTAGSDLDGARRDGFRESARRAALDRSTGEVRLDWFHAAQAAIDYVNRSFSVGAPKQGFRDALGLDPGDYMKRTPGVWTVTVEVFDA